MSFLEFLQYAEGAGINAIVGLILSYAVEWYPNWENLPSRIKRPVMLAVCMIVPLLALTIGLVTGTQSGDFNTLWWPVIVAGFTAFATSTVAHIRKL